MADKMCLGFLYASGIRETYWPILSSVKSSLSCLNELFTSRVLSLLPCVKTWQFLVGPSVAACRYMRLVTCIRCRCMTRHGGRWWVLNGGGGVGGVLSIVVRLCWPVVEGWWVCCGLSVWMALIDLVLFLMFLNLSSKAWCLFCSNSNCQHHCCRRGSWCWCGHQQWCRHHRCQRESWWLCWCGHQQRCWSCQQCCYHNWSCFCGWCFRAAKPWLQWLQQAGKCCWGWHLWGLLLLVGGRLDSRLLLMWHWCVKSVNYSKEAFKLFLHWAATFSALC